MAKCMLCDLTLNFWNSRKISNGQICMECSSKIPIVVRGDIIEYTDIEISNIIDYQLKARETLKKHFKGFLSTASYGDLLIDENSGYIGINKGKELDLFFCLDLKDVGISCTNIRVEGNNSVYADIELRCLFNKPNIIFETIIKKHVKCPITKNSPTDVEVREPNDLIMFKNLFNQMLKNADRNVGKKLMSILKNKNSLELLKAQTLFMVDEDYTLEDIKETKRILMKAFHPDEGNTSNIKYSQRINEAFKILKDSLEEDAIDVEELVSENMETHNN